MRRPDPSALLGSAAARATSLAVVLLPAAVLGLAADRANSQFLAAGAGLAAVVAVLFVRVREAWRPPASGFVIVVYVAAVAWLWAGTRANPDGLAHVGRGLLLVAAVFLVAAHDLARTGLGPRRRAARLCRQLLGRTRWPEQLAAYARLPEVRALQDAVHDDPNPVFALFGTPSPEVRAAAFVALQARDYWRPREAAAVLEAVRTSHEPAVRAAGLTALAGSADPEVLAAVADFLRDPSAEVRRAAAEALLARGAGQWPVVRDAVRAALADPALAADGTLPGSPGRLPAVAVCDLASWATEADPLAARATRTLIDHYAVLLQTGDHPELAADIGVQVTDPHTPPGLRLELAGLLRGLNMIPPDLLDRMSNVDQPGAIRLLAAEILLSFNPDDPDAIDVLRGLGRQSHRETVLAIARLLQAYLRLDMGLPAGTVAPNSKAAAEAAKLVAQWASGRPAPPPRPSAVTPPRIGLPTQRVAFPGHKSPASVPPRPPGHRGSSGQMWVPR